METRYYFKKIFKGNAISEDDCPCEVIDDGKYDNENMNTSKSYTQWSKIDDKIISVSNTFEKLEPGYYSIGMDPSVGLHFVKRNIELNKIYRLPNNASDVILDDIDKFWTLEDTYKKYSRVFRRNYLLYSAPGTGKTSLISLMCKDLIEKYNGIVFQITTFSELELYTMAIQRIRNIEPDLKIITVIEDIDAFIANDQYDSTPSTSYILNILDGTLKVGGIVTIATTNYIERLGSRLKNRPSRFDRVIEFPLPNDECRKMFIEKSVLPEDLEKIDIDKWVEKTKGFTIDHINELILLYFVFGHTEEESFKTISDMVNNNNRLKNNESINTSKIGFYGN